MYRPSLGSGDERWLPSFADIIILLDAVLDDAPGVMLYD